MNGWDDERTNGAVRVRHFEPHSADVGGLFGMGAVGACVFDCSFSLFIFGAARWGMGGFEKAMTSLKGHGME